MNDQKIAVITGANKGIGLETARQLARQGIKVIITARDPAKGQPAADKLEQEGLPVAFHQLDITDDAQRKALLEYLSSTHGRLDILVNNAGIEAEGGWGGNTVATITEQQLMHTMDTNFFSVVYLTQLLLPLIRKSSAGRIVNLSSIQGSMALHANPGSPIYNSKPFGYNVSKTALNQFTIHLAHALRDTPVKVNSAHPGWVKTDLGSDAAPLSVEDGAKTGVMLATLPSDGPTGKFFHLGKELPW